MALERGKRRDGGSRLAHRSPVVIQIVSNAAFPAGANDVGLQSLVLGLAAPVRALHVRAMSCSNVGAGVDGLIPWHRPVAPLRRRRSRTWLSRVPLRNEVFEKLRDAIDVPGRHGFI